MNVAFATAWFTYSTDHQQAEPRNPGLQATHFARLTALVTTRCGDPGQAVGDRALFAWFDLFDASQAY
jgi:hypothetical protein